MYKPAIDADTDVNRLTGGLEICHCAQPLSILVNRHTGGLEKPAPINTGTSGVNRHTGGLEMLLP